MNQQKGFSLVEVLASLLLVTVVALSLLQQQWQSRLLVLREQGTQLLDQLDETLRADAKKLSLTPSPFHLELKHLNTEVLLRLHLFKKNNFMIRRYYCSAKCMKRLRGIDEETIRV
jgi:prepilin-type N-terminal cleavage/methylation domain-containing protein